MHDSLSVSGNLVLSGHRLQVNMASDGESDEDFVTYGTPLEPLEEGIDKSYLNIFQITNCVIIFYIRANVKRF